MAAPDSESLGTTRSSFLQSTAALFGTLAVGSTLATLAPTRAWALELKSLAAPEGTTIIEFAQTLYPHKTLPTAVYAFVVRDVDKAAVADPAKAKVARDGIKALDAAAGGSFHSASPEARLAAAKKIEGSPFFTMVRSTCITALYDNELAYAHFGYPGASWPKGGYKHRGFNDLAWLPNPPEDASPTLGVLL
ncbi:MAG: hypothetical protein NVS2B3_00170 [Vulcanimicrobiaceae bacterium]